MRFQGKTPPHGFFLLNSFCFGSISFKLSPRRLRCVSVFSLMGFYTCCCFSFVCFFLIIRRSKFKFLYIFLSGWKGYWTSAVFTRRLTFLTCGRSMILLFNMLVSSLVSSSCRSLRLCCFLLAEMHFFIWSSVIQWDLKVDLLRSVGEINVILQLCMSVRMFGSR